MSPDKTTFTDWPGVPSPDGQRIAIVAKEEGSSQTSIWIRPLATETAQRITGTEGASGPFWSPDGRSLGFFAQGKLKRVDIEGGPPQNICNVLADLVATWGTSGDIILAPFNRTTLHRVPAAGGTPQSITTLNIERRENSHRWPYLLPDGYHFLFTARSNVKENTGIYVGSLRSSEVKRLVSAQSNGIYVPSGYLLYGREGTLVAQRFDSEKLEVSGEPLPIAGNVGQVTPSASTLFSVSRDGSVLSYQRTRLVASFLAWFNRSGSQSATVARLREATGIRLSPDGKRAAVVIPDPESGNRDIWIVDSTTGTQTRFSFDPANDWIPVWSPEGNSIVFASDRNEKSTIYRKAIAGNEQEEELVRTPAELGGAFPLDISRDGRFLLYQVDNGKAGTDVWVLPLIGDQRAYPFLATSFVETNARFSPNGSFVAYASNESGEMEVYIRPLAKPGKVKVSTSGGKFPSWRQDGKELVLRRAGKYPDGGRVKSQRIRRSRPASSSL